MDSINSLEKLIPMNTAMEGWKARRSWERIFISDTEEFNYITTGLPVATMNNAFPKYGDEFTSDGIKELFSIFSRTKTPFTIWALKESAKDAHNALIDTGFVKFTTGYGILIDPKNVDERTLNKLQVQGLEFGKVKIRSELIEWCSLESKVFQFGENFSSLWFEMQDQTGYDPDNIGWEHFFCKYDGKIIATVSVFFGKSAANIANLAAIYKKPYSGVGFALTVYAVRKAVERGYSVITSTATKPAFKITQRLNATIVSEIGLWRMEFGSRSDGVWR